ncbi:MAG: glycosyltransferase family 4 protein [Actinomycetota bacterium]|jgi:glycosyltransferase involved in cell wall biosynthesis|nr:glycosyltransferase family 4 protein [Actinomycetota bacterium]
MRVVVDARPALEARKTGVGHYTTHLLRALPSADPVDEITAWYLHAKGLLRPHPLFPGVPGLQEKASRIPRRVFESLSGRLGEPRIERFVDFDVLLATNFLPPATSSPGVVLVVHDLAFRKFPETAPHMNAGWLHRFEAWLARAARLIVPSVSARDDLRELYGVDPDRIDAIHHGVDAHAFRPAPEPVVADVRRRFEISGPYALFVGGIEPRKNLERLVRAFGRLRGLDDVSLVIAGGPVRWFPQAVQQLDDSIAALPAGVRSRVIRTGYVSQADKVALMTGATLMVYPSRYEGFGFPVMEAFAAGLPVLTSNVSSLPEVAGDAAELVDPDDTDAIAEALERMLQDRDLLDNLAAAGVARVSGFTWEATARATAATLHRARETARG